MELKPLQDYLCKTAWIKIRVLFLLNRPFPFSQSKNTTHDSDDIYINTPSSTSECSSNFWTNGFSVTMGGRAGGRVGHHAASSGHFTNQPGGLVTLPGSVNRDVFTEGNDINVERTQTAEVKLEGAGGPRVRQV